MARSIRAPSIKNRTNRLKLAARRKPYFVGLSPGISLGYRRNNKSGSWSVRATGPGGTWLKGFATADDFENADGVHVLTFHQAVERARELARSADGGGGKPVTVLEAVNSYAADLRGRSGDTVNASRILRHLPPHLAQKPVAMVTARELRAWRDKLVEQGLARASASRTGKALKAALNLACRDDPRLASAAWRSGLSHLADSDPVRNITLPDADIHRLIEGAYSCGREFGLFVETLAMTGARASQILRLEIPDLVDGPGGPRLMVPASRKGSKRRSERQPVPIPPGLAAMLREAAGDRSGDSPLLNPPTNPGRLFTRLVAGLGLPSNVTPYAFRHSSITRLLLAGVPVRLVAAAHDTSVAQIERTYSRNILTDADTLIRRALLGPATPTGDNIVPLVGRRE